MCSFQSEKLSPEEEKTEKKKEQDVGFFESALAGVATGLWNIPKGFVSLGAELIDLGFDCILTSGQKEKAEEGIENLIYWNTKFGSDIIIMPGSGVGVTNCKKFKNIFNKYDFVEKKL